MDRKKITNLNKIHQQQIYHLRARLNINSLSLNLQNCRVVKRKTKNLQ